MADDAIGIIVSFALLTLAIILAFFILWIAIPLGVIAAIYCGYVLYQQSPAVKERKAKKHTHDLYNVATQHGSVVPDKMEFGRRVYKLMPEGLPDNVENDMLAAALTLYDAELFAVEIPPPPAICNSIEGARYRDFISSQSAKQGNEGAAHVAVQTIVESIGRFLAHVPEVRYDKGVDLSVPFLSVVEHPGEAIEALILPYYGERPTEFGLFRALKEQLDRNLHDLSGVPFAREYRDHPALISPTEYEGDNIGYAYLKDTPFLDIADAHVPYAIPDDAWFEHAWCLAPPGTGKTQLIQYLISRRLSDVQSGNGSIIVIDSQGDLIKNVRSQQCFAPGEPLHDCLLVIEPDLDHPPALNIFDFGRDRLTGYSPTQKEQVTNIAIAQMTYVLDALMGEAGSMTTKQATLYRYVIRLLMEIPGSTLSTFSDVLGVTKAAQLVEYGQYIDRLSQPAQDFFKNQFLDGEFSGTKRQVAWRISNLRENAYFESMFSHERSKVDLFAELNEPKVILIDTSKKKLGDDGTNVFGRYFIGALLSASQERATLERGERLDVWAFIDEAQDYISTDAKIATLLDQARKMRISMFLAHQRTKQIKDGNVLDALQNAAVKFASTDSARDADVAAKALHTTEDFINGQPERHFALHVRRQGPAVSVRVPFLVLEKAEQMSNEDAKAVQRTMWGRFSSEEHTDPKASQPGPKHKNVEPHHAEAAEEIAGHDPDNPPDKPSRDW